MAKRTSVWRNSFKTFRQFGETIIMVLIANIRSDVIQILVRLYFISYATVTATFRITKMTTRSLATMSLARRHIRQGLSFALYDGSHASKYNCGIFNGMTHNARESWHPRWRHFFSRRVPTESLSSLVG